MKNPFKKSTVREGCRIDKNTGQFICESKRVLDDGTEVDLGKISGGLTGDCEVSADEFYENEPGVLDRLNKRLLSRIKGKCKTVNKPSDY